jgi:hypothetical protein
MNKLEWNGEEAINRIQAEMNKRLNRAAMVVERHAKELVSVSGTGVRIKSGTTKGYQKKQRSIARRKQKRAKKRGIRENLKRKRKIAKAINTGIKLRNKYGKRFGIGKTKKRVRLTKKGKFTTRKKYKRKKKGG